MRMPGVAEVAVVAAPDAALGEIGCAHFRMLHGTPAPDLDAVRAALDAAGLAKQKWPELVREVAEFPRTPSGKIQKFVLRQRLREEAAAVTRRARRCPRRSPACACSTSAGSCRARSARSCSRRWARR